MAIFITGVVMFTVGAALNAIGWIVHQRSLREAPEGYWSWLLEQLHEWFGKMVGSDSTPGERLAAFGALIAALGFVVAVIGVISWAA